MRHIRDHASLRHCLMQIDNNIANICKTIHWIIANIKHLIKLIMAGVNHDNFPVIKHILQILRFRIDLNYCLSSAHCENTGSSSDNPPHFFWLPVAFPIPNPSGKISSQYEVPNPCIHVHQSDYGSGFWRGRFSVLFLGAVDGRDMCTLLKERGWKWLKWRRKHASISVQSTWTPS